jgi:putative transposase
VWCHPTLWSSSFFAASIGAVSAATVEKYINTQWERPWKEEKGAQS